MHVLMPLGLVYTVYKPTPDTNSADLSDVNCLFTASNLCLLLQKEQNVKGGEGPSGKQAVGINNGTR